MLICESLQELLSTLFGRLKLKDEPVRTYVGATDEELDQIWDVIGRFDDKPVAKESADQQSLLKALKERYRILHIWFRLHFLAF